MKIAIASDHAAVDLKAELAQWLRGEGHQVEDLGPANADRVDYPDYGYKLATAVARARCAVGRLMAVRWSVSSLCGGGLRL